MPSVIAAINYGYVQIGSPEDIATANMSQNAPNVSEFLSVDGSVLRLQVGTHTGDVELDFVIVDRLTELATKRGAAGIVSLALRGNTLQASTFNGLVSGFEIRLPETWTSVTVRASSERYLDASSIGEFDDLDPPERVLVEFAAELADC